MTSSMPLPHFTPGKDPVSILQEAGWAPGPVWTGGKSRPHRGSIPDRPSLSPVAIPTGLPYPRNTVSISLVSHVDFLCFFLSPVNYTTTGAANAPIAATLSFTVNSDFSIILNLLVYSFLNFFRLLMLYAPTFLFPQVVEGFSFSSVSVSHVDVRCQILRVS